MSPDRLRRIASALEGVEGAAAIQRLLVLCLEMLSVSGAVVAVITDGQHRGSVAVSDPRAGAVDDLQFSLGEGPCIAANASPGPVIESDLKDVTTPWPAFAPAAVALGFVAAFSFPLRVGPVGLGVLSLYRTTPGDLSTGDLADAMALARIVTHLLLDVGHTLAPGVLPQRLSEVTESRVVVHQATGMVAAQLNTDVANALARLRAFAWSGDRSIADVAADVVARRIRFDDGT